MLLVGGKPLIAWQIERLVRAGFDELVINVSYRAAQITAALGDGTAFGARIAYSEESEPLESAGGLAKALPQLGEGPVLVVAADVYAEFEYGGLVGRCSEIASGASHQAHLVLVPNPGFRPNGDYSLSAAGWVGTTEVG